MDHSLWKQQASKTSHGQGSIPWWSEWKYTQVRMKRTAWKAVRSLKGGAKVRILLLPNKFIRRARGLVSGVHIANLMKGNTPPTYESCHQTLKTTRQGERGFESQDVGNTMSSQVQL
jgi:hypothetical protein